MANDEDFDWKVTMYERIIADAHVKNLAWSFAETARTDDDPVLAAGDMEAARRYLRACVLNMTVNEISNLDSSSAAALWARGAAGAAAYRVGRRGGGASGVSASPHSAGRRRDRDR